MDNPETVAPRAEAWDKGWLVALTRAYEKKMATVPEHPKEEKS